MQKYFSHTFRNSSHMSLVVMLVPLETGLPTDRREKKNAVRDLYSLG